MTLKLCMKCTWQLLCCLLLLVACSDDAIEEQSSITLPPETEEIFEKGVNFTTTAGTQSLAFEATEDWEITTATTRNGETWYQVYPLSGGPGKAEISISVDENEGYDERSVAITINAGKTNKTLMISQKPKEALLVTSNRMEMKQEGGTLNIEVQANVEYKAIIADDCQSWIKPSAASTRGLTTTTASFTISPNEERVKREGKIYITDGKLTEEIDVYQHGGDIVLLNENEYPVGDRGETIKVELRSNCAYGVKMPDVDWIKEAVLTRGMSSHTVYYTISANEKNEARRAQIIFYDKDNTSIADTLTVIQAQKDAVVVDAKSIELKSPNDTIISIDVNANVEVEVRPADTCQWITESTATRGLQLRKIYLKAARNESFAPRRGRVLVKSKNGNECDTLKIWQAGKPTSVKLEQAALDVPKEGGTYRIKVDADVAVAMKQWQVLEPESDYLDRAPIDQLPDDEFWSSALFYYENKAGMSYEAALSADGQYLEIKVNPALSSQQAASVTVTVYGEHENKEAKLTITQEPDPTKVVRLRLANLGQQVFAGILYQSYTALKQVYTQEEAYSRQGEQEQIYNEWRAFINHELTADNSRVAEARNLCYSAINSMLFMKYGVQISKQEELTPTDSTFVMALLDMQRFILHYQMANIWGQAVCLDEYSTSLEDTNSPAMTKKELLLHFTDPLLLLREYLPAEKSALATADDYFFPSRDFPSLLLARIYVEQNKYAEAKALLTEIVNSGKYKLGDMIYVMPNPNGTRTPRGVQSFEYVSDICFSYVEVMLMLSECEQRLGNIARAEEYLNTVVIANVGTPAYPSNVELAKTRSADDFINRLADVWQIQLKGTGTYFAFMKRNGIAEQRLNIPTWRLVFPIPIQEVHTNMYIKQNEGYN